MPKLTEHSCDSCPSRGGSVFCELSPDRLADVDAHKSMNRYERGQVLFHEGNPLLGVYCIESGRIKLVKHGADGKDVLLRICGPGELLGIRGLLTDQPYSVSAIVMEDCTVCFIDQAFMKKLVHVAPDTAFEIMKRLSDQVRSLEDRVSDLSNKNVRQRMIQLLLMFVRSYGKERYDGMFIHLKISRTEMASMINTTPETVMRVLSDLQSEETLKLNGKEIVILNKDALHDELTELV